MFRLRSPGACSLQAVLGKVTQTSYLLFAPFGGTQKYTAAFRAVSCTLCCLRFQAFEGKPSFQRPSYCSPAKALRKKKSLPVSVLLPTCGSAAKERKASRPSSYCPPAKALRKKKSLPPFVLPPACKNVKRKQVRGLCDFAEPSLETIGSRRRRRSTNAYLFS